MLMERLLVHANNSLVAQSLSARKRSKPVNGDGFGVGWYPMHDDPEPGVFSSIEPAWSNRNLYQIAGKVMSHCFFAHVRDASIGMPVSEANCHPFLYGRYLWMHNGHLDQFHKIKRPLINQLSDRAYQLIQGNTDSEHAFSLFLDHIGCNDLASADDMRNGMVSTMRRIMELRRSHGDNTNAYMNFGITNGQTTIVTRFSSKAGEQPPSLYFAKGKLLPDDSGEFRLMPSDEMEKKAVIIASEPLKDFQKDWIMVKSNHMLKVDAENNLDIESIPLPFQDDI